MDDPMIPQPKVARFFGVDRRTIANWRARGQLPAPERLPNGRPAWRMSVLERVVRESTERAAA